MAGGGDHRGDIRGNEKSHMYYGQGRSPPSSLSILGSTPLHTRAADTKLGSHVRF